MRSDDIEPDGIMKSDDLRFDHMRSNEIENDDIVWFQIGSDETK